MLTVVELLDKAADCDRMAREARNPLDKTQHLNLADFFRFLARERAKVLDAKPAGESPPIGVHP